MDVPPPGYLRAVVERRLDVADDLAVFWLRPAEPLAFRPGQYVTLAMPAGRGVVKRAYSVASAPHEPLVELVIEHVPDGALTPVLWPLRAGDAVWVRRKVVGHFVLDAARTRHVMACTVTGVAPFLSMLRAHVAARTAGETADHRFLVVHGASRSAEFGPYRAELARLAAEGWVIAVPTVSRPWADPRWDGEVGRVEDVLRKHLDRLGWLAADVAGYACGHPQMIETVLGLLRRARVDAAHLHEEKYFTVGEAAPAVEVEAAPPPTVGRRPGAVVLKTAPRPADPEA
ncbi:FAD-binding oxidoreductase [Rubrivirga sp.]|uniref:FAD-binding oxidoreductase n=1 Tax=Rubrivirga sp. TaxID=1885344 RepID=UPI003B524376